MYIRPYICASCLEQLEISPGMCVLYTVAGGYLFRSQVDLNGAMSNLRLSLLLYFLYAPSPGYVDLISVYVEN